MCRKGSRGLGGRIGAGGWRGAWVQARAGMTVARRPFDRLRANGGWVLEGRFPPARKRQLRERAAAVLGEVLGQGLVYCQCGAVRGESRFIRERARELGVSLQDLAERVGVSPAYMTQPSRGQQRMGAQGQACLEAALKAPPEATPAQRACADQNVVWDRMDAHGVSQNEVARQAGVSRGDHGGEGHTVAGGAAAAARRPLPAVAAGGASHVRRVTGGGMAQGQAERDGGARRRRAECG